ncbi:MAG: glycerol-3-phosphate dehydrogenase, partial [Kamptonema sp. SIO4C4]|nr:glycerol-3-phosphate dehydrogenase [Kamptonema sp. SIO4C4]
LAEPISPRLPDIKAQIVYAIRSEMAHTFLDITRRRTTIAMQDHYGLDAVPIMVDVAQKFCGWTAEKCDRAVVEYHHYMSSNCIPDYALETQEEAVMQEV